MIFFSIFFIPIQRLLQTFQPDKSSDCRLIMYSIYFPSNDSEFKINMPSFISPLVIIDRNVLFWKMFNKKSKLTQKLEEEKKRFFHSIAVLIPWQWPSKSHSWFSISKKMLWCWNYEIWKFIFLTMFESVKWCIEAQHFESFLFKCIKTHFHSARGSDSKNMNS